MKYKICMKKSYLLIREIFFHQKLELFINILIELSDTITLFKTNAKCTNCVFMSRIEEFLNWINRMKITSETKYA